MASPGFRNIRIPAMVGLADVTGSSYHCGARYIGSPLLSTIILPCPWKAKFLGLNRLPHLTLTRLRPQLHNPAQHRAIFPAIHCEIFRFQPIFLPVIHPSTELSRSPTMSSAIRGERAQPRNFTLLYVLIFLIHQTSSSSFGVKE